MKSSVALSGLALIGRRIEIHPATDRWMRGDRYGTITGVSGDRYEVQFDRSGQRVAVQHRDIYREFGLAKGNA